MTKIKKDKTSEKISTQSSRRKFILGSAAAGAGLATASFISPTQAASSTTEKNSGITVPQEVPSSQKGALTPGSFNAKKGMTGAQVFAKACKEENLAAMFCCPGNYTVINSIAAEGTPVYGGRTEGAMCAAADAFARVTGEVTACSGTEGRLYQYDYGNILGTCLPHPVNGIGIEYADQPGRQLSRFSIPVSAAAYRRYKEVGQADYYTKSCA